MPAPGLAFATRLVIGPLIYCIVGTAAGRLLFPFGLLVPTKWLVTGLIASLPVALALKAIHNLYSVEYEAALLGARLMPVHHGQMFGNVDIMFRLAEFFKTGYPGDGMTDAVDVRGPCFNIRVMYGDFLFTCEPQHIKAILATDFDNFVKGDRFRAVMLNVLGSGVFNSDAEMWKFHRSMTRPFFTRDRISHFNIFDRHAENVIKQMKDRFRAGYPVDFQDATLRFTLDSATEFLFGKCVNSLSSGLHYPYNVAPTKVQSDDAKFADDFARAFAGAQYVISRRMRMPWLWPVFEFFSDETTAPMKVVNAYIEPILKDTVEKAKAENTLGNEKSNNVDEDTLLDHLVRLTTDTAVLRDEILNIMIAGRDTTTGVLTFVVYLLSTHPHVFARLREEVMAKVRPTDRPTYEAIREMKYLRAVINETLRLFPPVPFNVRESVNATTLPASDLSEKPYYVPAKTFVCYSVFLMHRRKDLWGPDAEEFDPDRFLDHRLHKYLTPQPSIFLPFNAGPRICLGQQFAYNEISLLLIRLLQNFDSISLAPEAQAPDTLPPAIWKEAEGRKATEKVFPKVHLTLYVHGGLWVKMTEAGNEAV